MEEYTRRLILVPIIHSPADMGSMGTELAEACIDRLGRRNWEDYLEIPFRLMPYRILVRISKSFLPNGWVVLLKISKIRYLIH